MPEILKTSDFDSWLRRLKDRSHAIRMLTAIDRMGLGNFGDSKSVGAGFMELRLFFGPGYRLYYTRRGTKIVLLLVGGDKASQSKDIQKAQRLLAAVNLQQLEDP